MNNKNMTLRRAFAGATAALVSASVFAGGPLNTNPADPDGVERWPNGGQNIPFNIDQGDLGPLSNAVATQQVIDAFQRWEDIPTASNTYSNNGQIPFDVDVTNYVPFIQNLFFGANTADDLSPVVFDADGSIFVDLFGVSGVLGFASTDTRDAAGNPIEAVCFLNGGLILSGFPVSDFEGVIFHEFGHYSGLAHTVVNGQNVALGDATGPSPNNTYGNSPPDQVETMYPFAIVGGGQVTPHADDVAILSFLYPEPDFFATTGTISGTIFAANGVTPLTGVNVIARNVNDPFVDAVSAISGDRPVNGSGGYVINGLTPGETYTVHVDQIQQGGFSTPPIALPGPEEFYNVGESDDVSSPDDPADATPVASVAGSPTTGIDVIFNALPPGNLDLGDDDFVELFLPFEFAICGQVFDSVFVNSNGSLTFGAGSTAFAESPIAHLTGPPRIAGLWDDLNPSAGGAISFTQSASEFAVTWAGVPEFFSTGSNTFTIRLKSELGTFVQRRGRGGQTGLSTGFGNNTFDIEYGAISAVDGLAGYSCGGGVSIGLEPGSDLSADDLGRLIPRTTGVYEQFTFTSPNDLAGTTLNLGSGTFADGYEFNNTPETARSIRRLPFKTERRYSDIAPVGDVDFYEFQANAGEIVTAEIVAGQIDTVLVLGRVEADGSLTVVDFNDDISFPVNTLSAVQTPIDQTGTYFVGVSTFPDLNFTGDGFETGRYAISIEASTAITLSLGDDDSQEVALPFPFPFQGQVYDSVFVNSNGNLTFGAGDTDFSESTAELLNEQPRIAPLWDDLSPNQGGEVTVDFAGGVVTIAFEDVPEFFASTTNTFSVTLAPNGDITVAYGVISAADGIAGITEGGGAADPGPTDLSAAPNQSNAGTVYEQFTFADPNDLTGLILSYTN